MDRRLPQIEHYVLFAGGLYLLYRAFSGPLLTLRQQHVLGDPSTALIEQNDPILSPLMFCITEQIPNDAKRSSTPKTTNDVDREMTAAYYAIKARNGGQSSNNPRNLTRKREATQSLHFVCAIDEAQVHYEGDTFRFTQDEDGAVKVWHMTKSREQILQAIEQIGMAYIRRTYRLGLTIYRPNISNNGATWEESNEMVYAMDIENMCMNPTDKAKLLEDIEKFFHNHSTREDPAFLSDFRRLYLLHGPSGCGKTALVRAIAKKYELRIFELDVTQPGLTDELIPALFQQVGPRDLLLIENVDRLEDPEADAEVDDKPGEQGSGTPSPSDQDGTLLHGPETDLEKNSK